MRLWEDESRRAWMTVAMYCNRNVRGTVGSDSDRLLGDVVIVCSSAVAGR